MSVKTVQAIVNGQTVTLTQNSSTGKWEGTITAPSKSSYNQTGHYYPVELQATDDAGNIAYCARYVVTIDTAALCVHLEQYPYYFHVIKGYETEAYISPYYACCEGEYQTESWMSDYYATIMLQKCGGIG